MLGFVTQVQSAQVINLSKKKGGSVTDNTDQENNLVRYDISGFKYRGETYVQTNFEFSGLYDEIWPIKLTDHSKFTN